MCLYSNTMEIGQRITFTIDPETARDLDDAISVTNENDDHWIVGVHIADVSRHVTPGSDLDKHAQLNMTSTYLPRKVLPMLPEILSNGECSLTPGSEKNVLSVFWRINKKTWKRGKPFFKRDTMLSDRRFSYDECQSALEGSCGDPVLDEALSVVFEMHQRIRQKFGARWLSVGRQSEIDFVFEGEKIVGVKPHPVLDSMKLVETWMVEANCAAARFIAEHCPASNVVVRQHECFRQDKSKVIAKQLAIGGCPGISLTSKDAFIDTLKKFPDPITKQRIGCCASFALSKANYFTVQDCKDQEISHSHWSLDREIYTHFTSPIRRFPDILVHRAIINVLEGNPEAPICDEGQNVSLILELANAKMKEASKKEREHVSKELIALINRGVIPKKQRVFVSSIESSGDKTQHFLNVHVVGEIQFGIRPMRFLTRDGHRLRDDGALLVSRPDKRSQMVVKPMCEFDVVLRTGSDVIFANIPFYKKK